MTRLRGSAVVGGGTTAATGTARIARRTPSWRALACAEMAHPPGRPEAWAGAVNRPATSFLLARTLQWTNRSIVGCPCGRLARQRKLLVVSTPYFPLFKTPGVARTRLCQVPLRVLGPPAPFQPLGHWFLRVVSESAVQRGASSGASFFGRGRQSPSALYRFKPHFPASCS